LDYYINVEWVCAEMGSYHNPPQKLNIKPVPVPHFYFREKSGDGLVAQNQPGSEVLDRRNCKTLSAVSNSFESI
jgi:hypothetical protein